MSEPTLASWAKRLLTLERMGDDLTRLFGEASDLGIPSLWLQLADVRLVVAANIEAELEIARRAIEKESTPATKGTKDVDRPP